MDVTLRLLNAGLMMALPLVLGALLARRYGVGWSLFGWGAVTFVGSQVVHLPLLQGLTIALRDAAALKAHALLVNAIILGVAAGVCEEGARYVGYRYLVPEARSWAKALMLGAGHGGTEALVLGGLSGAAALRTIASGTSFWDVTALAAAPTTALFLPAGLVVPLLGAVERLFALADHLAMSVIVLQVFLRRSWRWLLAAIGWHAALDGVAVYGAATVAPVALEGILGLFAVASVAIVVWLRPRARPAS
jgi:uncharacterized membrane protein YhfC